LVLTVARSKNVSSLLAMVSSVSGVIFGGICSRPHGTLLQRHHCDYVSVAPQWAKDRVKTQLYLG
jgi:hypothetical protein